MRDGEKYTTKCTTCAEPIELTYWDGCTMGGIECSRCRMVADIRRKKRNKKLAWAIGIAVAVGLLVTPSNDGDSLMLCNPMHLSVC